MDFLSLTNLLKIVHFLAAFTGYICWIGILCLLIRFVRALRRELKKKKMQESGTLANFIKLWHNPDENASN